MNSLHLTNPYPGLRAFSQAEAGLFFGREQEIREGLRILRQEKFLLISGRPGTGKSSLLHAGIVPQIADSMQRLSAEHTLKVFVQLQKHPVNELANALADALHVRDENLKARIETRLCEGKNGLNQVFEWAGISGATPLVLAIDQLEVLFGMTAVCAHTSIQEREAAQFLDLLLEALGDEVFDVYVAAAIDCTCLDHLMDFAGMAELVNKGLYFLPLPEEEALHKIITAPAAGQGIHVQEDVAGRLMERFRHTSWPLPKLQTTLNRMYNVFRKSGRQKSGIDLQILRQTGRIDEAFDAFAETVYQALPENQKAIAEKLLKALTCRSDFGWFRRRQLTLRRLSEITGANESRLAEIVEHFRQNDRELLGPGSGKPLRGQTRIALCHETAIYLWHRLHNWAKQEEAAGALYRKLRAAALRYQQQEEALWQPPELLLAKDLFDNQAPGEAWAGLYGGNFAETEAFYRESLRQAETKARQPFREQEDKLAQQRKVASSLRSALNRNRWLAIGATAVAVVALLVAWFVHRKKADTIHTLIRSKSDMLVSYANLNNKQDPTIALNFAYQALQEDPENPKAYGALVDVYYSGAPFYKQIVQSVNPVTSLAFSPVKKILASASGKRVNIRRPDGTREFELPAFEGNVRKIRFFEGGKQLLVWCDENRMAVWDINRRKELATRVFPFSIADYAIAEGGKTIFLANKNKQVFQSHYGLKDLRRVCRTRRPVNSLALDGGGQKLACGLVNGETAVYALDGQKISTFKAHRGAVWNVAFSPDGQSLLTSSGDRSKSGTSAKLWNLQGQLLRKYPVPTRQLTEALFGPDSTVFTISFGGSIRQWDASGDMIHSFKGHQASVNDLVILPGDPARLYSASGDTTGGDNGIRLWHYGKRYRKIAGSAEAEFHNLAVSPDAHQLLSGAGTSQAMVLTAGLQPQYKLTSGEHAIAQTIWMKGEAQLAVAMRSGNVRVYSAKGRFMHDFTTRDTSLTVLAWSARGKLFFAGNSQGRIRAYSKKGRLLSGVFGHQQAVNSLCVSENGQLLLSASADSTAVLWSSEGEKLVTYAPNYGRVTDASFAPGSRLIATASTDSMIRLWSYKGVLKNRLHGHSHQINAVGFTPQENYVFSASNDYTLRLWNTRGTEIATLHHGLYQHVLDAGFSAAESKIFTASSDFMKGKTYLTSWNIGKTYLETMVRRHFLLNKALLPQGS